MIIAPIYGAIVTYPKMKSTPVTEEQRVKQLKAQIVNMEREIKWGYGANRDPYSQTQHLRDLITELEKIQNLKNQKKG
jgi:hypothetical protein